MQKNNIIVVDDHALFRSGLITLLSDLEEVGKIYEAPNGKVFLELISENDIDIALMDISMPEMDGVEATIKSLEMQPEIKIIALSMFSEEEYYFKMINAGVRGFLIKDSTIDEVREAIRVVGKGGNYFSQEILYKLIKKGPELLKVEESLSDRESEILELICQGYSNQEIADQLFLSKRTVDKHRANVLEKTSCRNTACLVVYAIKWGLVKL
jgi:DNA-binding NarL/FixJ family response regulator